MGSIKKMVWSIQQPDGEHWKKLHKKSPRAEDVCYFPTPQMKNQQTKAINKCTHSVCSRVSAEHISLQVSGALCGGH